VGMTNQCNGSPEDQETNSANHSSKVPETKHLAVSPERSCVVEGDGPRCGSCGASLALLSLLRCPMVIILTLLAEID
jgi:hypothetical protein